MQNGRFTVTFWIYLFFLSWKRTPVLAGSSFYIWLIVTPDAVTRAADLGLNARVGLAENDGHGFFEALGDQIITGPTLTNVNNFHAIPIT
jgi:glycerate-2-kinase